MYKGHQTRTPRKPKEDFQNSNRMYPALAEALAESRRRLNKIPQVKNVTSLSYSNEDRELIVLASIERLQIKFDPVVHTALSIANHELSTHYKKKGIKLSVTFGW